LIYVYAPIDKPTLTNNVLLFSRQNNMMITLILHYISVKPSK